MVDPEILGAIWGAIGAAAVLIPFTVWLVGPRVEKSVVRCVEANAEEIKKSLGIDDLERKVTTNAHSITGLRGLVTTQESELKTLLTIQPAMVRLAENVAQMSARLLDVNNKLYDIGRESANILGLLGNKVGD